MFKQITLITLALIVLSGCQQSVTLQFPPACEPAPGPTYFQMVEQQESQATRNTRLKLKELRVTLDFKNNGFEQILTYLHNATKLNITPNWEALKEQGIEPGQPVTLKTNSISVEKALRLILEDVGGELVRLDYAVEDDIVIVASKEFLDEKTVIRSYDIRDLIWPPSIWAKSNFPKPEFDLQTIAVSPEKKDLFDSPDKLPPDWCGTLVDKPDKFIARLTEQNITWLMDLIRNTIDTDGWRAMGGLSSSIDELNGTLFIKTTMDNQREIAKLLDQFREQYLTCFYFGVQLIVLPDEVFTKQIKPGIKITPAHQAGELMTSGAIPDNHAATILEYAQNSGSADVVALPGVIVPDSRVGQVVAGQVVQNESPNHPMVYDLLKLPIRPNITHGISHQISGTLSHNRTDLVLQMDTTLVNDDDPRPVRWHIAHQLTMPLGQTLMIDGGNIPKEIVQLLCPKLKVGKARLLILVKARITNPGVVRK